MNCLFDMKLRSVVILVIECGERDRFVIRSTSERGCTPLDSEEVSRNVREHQEGLVNTVAVTNRPGLVKSGITEEATGASTLWTARGKR